MMADYDIASARSTHMHPDNTFRNTLYMHAYICKSSDKIIVTNQLTTPESVLVFTHSLTLEKSTQKVQQIQNMSYVHVYNLR